MRKHLLAFAALLLLGSQAPAKAPAAERNEMGDVMAKLGGVLTGNGLQRAIAAAEKHPLGSKQNPVRVDGPPGEIAYLTRLRCGDGSRPQVGTRITAGEGPFGTIMDEYPLRCGSDGATSVHMDMYFRPPGEDRPPPGFSIQPAAIEGPTV